MTPSQAVVTLLAVSWMALSAAVAFGHAGHEHESGPKAPEPAALVTEIYEYEPPAPGTYRLPAIRPAAGGAVLDETGAQRELAELLDGRITILSFIYTRCGDVCPHATLVLYELQGLSAEDPALARNLQFLSLSFDPGHDTPAVMAEYGQALRDPAGAPWHFLTTPGEAALAPILAAYDQPVAAKPNPEDRYGPLAHQLRLYLIDRVGRIRNIYSLGFLDPRLLIADVRTLLLEEQVAEARP